MPVFGLTFFNCCRENTSNNESDLPYLEFFMLWLRRLILIHFFCIHFSSYSFSYFSTEARIEHQQTSDNNAAGISSSTPRVVKEDRAIYSIESRYFMDHIILSWRPNIDQHFWFYIIQCLWFIIWTIYCKILYLTWLFKLLYVRWANSCLYMSSKILSVVQYTTEVHPPCFSTWLRIRQTLKISWACNCTIFEAFRLLK